MPDEAQTPPPQSADAAGQATPPPDLPTEAASAQAGVAAPAPEPSSLSPQTNPEDLNGQESKTETDKPTPQETPAPSVRRETGEKGEEKGETTTTPSQSPPSTPVVAHSSLRGAEGGKARRGDLAVANAKIQETKRKKLDKIMALFERRENGSTSSPQVTNDEVEKLLHVSDATATRYLQSLEKENRIKQTGSTGKAVFYEKI